MDPTQRELETQLVCQLLVYIESVGIFDMILSNDIFEGANHFYGKAEVNDVDELTATLCNLCQQLEQSEEGQKIIYDGKNRDARKLADWWQNHQEMDRQREQKRKEKENRKKLKEQALAKLTEEEKEAFLH
jgi:thiamine pyrophosphate-dependent acetolactate synthase large subunit-like protein